MADGCGTKGSTSKCPGWLLESEYSGMMYTSGFWLFWFCPPFWLSKRLWLWWAISLSLVRPGILKLLRRRKVASKLPVFSFLLITLRAFQLGVVLCRKVCMRLRRYTLLVCLDFQYCGRSRCRTLPALELLHQIQKCTRKQPKFQECWLLWLITVMISISNLFSSAPDRGCPKQQWQSPDRGQRRGFRMSCFW